MTVIPLAMDVPETLWHAVQALATHDGDPHPRHPPCPGGIRHRLHKRGGRRQPGQYQQLVKAPSTPVADLKLSARPASALKMLTIRYVYELAQKSPLDLFRLANFGNKSLREVKEKLAKLGLTLGMTLEDDAYSAAVVATVAASLGAARG